MPENVENAEREYTAKEVAERWQVTERTVLNYIAKRWLPSAYKVGLGSVSHWRIPESDVIEFEKKRKEPR